MTYLEFSDRMQVFPVFSVREIEKHFPGFDSRRLVEWQEKGYITKLRNRYYYFTNQRVDEDFLYYCANKLYSPSYVSLESALSIYGFIPEGVFQIISCTTLKTNKFETPVGNFSYRNLKPALFFGYHLQSWNGHYYAIAEPEKTLIDYLYLYNDIQSLEYFDDLRWNAWEILNRISMEKLTKYETHISSAALSKRINLLINYLNANA